MVDWRWLAYDLVTDAYLRDLDVSGWQSTDELNGAGGFTATVKVPGDVEEAQSVRASTRCGRTAIVALRGDVPVFDGIIWRRNYESSVRSVTIAGRKLASFWDHFDIPAHLDFAATEQADIWRSLLAGVALNFPNGDIGVAVDATTTGIVRDRVYEPWEAKKYGEAMQQLAAVDGGFDWDIRVESDGLTLTRQARLWYPRRGRPITTTGLQFRTGSTAKLFGVTEDATGMAARVTGFGAGEGIDTLTSVRQTTELTAAGYPGYAKSLSLRDVKTQAPLDEHTQAELSRAQRIDADGFVVTLDPTHPDQVWGSWDLGDDCTLVIEDDPWYPRQDDGTPGASYERRIVAHEWNVAGGQETLKAALTKRAV